MNYQSWVGADNARYGYGSMLKSFLDNAPKGVEFNRNADVVVNMLPPYHANQMLVGQYRTCFTMWESTVLPKRFESWLKVYDEIFVPCAHNLELFSGHHPKVSLVPLGVDHKVWRPIARPSNPRFRFHAGGSLWLRKGLDVVLEAFKLAGLDAELHLKISPEARDVPVLNLPDNVFVHRTWLTAEETFAWFNQADCYVSTTRGEGFGLMPLQAMAMGIPVIMNASSGQNDFAYLGSIVVGHKPLPSIYGGDWDQSDPKEIAEAMRDMVANFERYKTGAKNQVKDTQVWSYKNAARKLVGALPTGGLLVDPKQMELSVMYQVVVTRTCDASINGIGARFVSGKSYVVAENMYEVLLNAGYLDTSKVEIL